MTGGGAWSRIVERHPKRGGARETITRAGGYNTRHASSTHVVGFLVADDVVRLRRAGGGQAERRVHAPGVPTYHHAGADGEGEGTDGSVHRPRRHGSHPLGEHAATLQ